MDNYHGKAHGIPLKKRFGQHFLRKESVVENMVDKVDLTESSSVFEIGCGDGFLTKAILKKPLTRLWIFEIDPQWVEYVRKTYLDNRMTIFAENILDIDFNKFEPYAPWILLANLPYQITFPIIYKLIANRHLLKEGVIMVQEEVAQKIVQKSGRGYGLHSLYLQHFFDWELLEKVPPSAFVPPPKVDSRLLYFKPIKQLDEIPQEQEFWQFIKNCFLQPRRNLKNNLHMYDVANLSEETLNLRAQQMSKKDLLQLWDVIRKTI